MKGKGKGLCEGRGLCARSPAFEPLLSLLLLQGEEGASKDSGQEAQQQYLRGQDKRET